jgi:hypothetical protein
MNRLEKLIRDMRRQLFPYSHEHDTERDGGRWDVDRKEYISSWLAANLHSCRKKNRCYKRRKCVYYDYSDLARRNFDICYELLLRIENGDIRLQLEDNTEDKET